jgi:hypothetical protein
MKGKPMKAFRYEVPSGTIADVALDADTRSSISTARTKGTHGVVTKAVLRSSHAVVDINREALQSASPAIRDQAEAAIRRGGSTTVTVTFTQLGNWLRDDADREDARRRAYRTAHPRVQCPNGDPRFARPAPLDPELAHHRR